MGDAFHLEPQVLVIQRVGHGVGPVRGEDLFHQAVDALHDDATRLIHPRFAFVKGMGAYGVQDFLVGFAGEEEMDLPVAVTLGESPGFVGDEIDFAGFRIVGGHFFIFHRDALGFDVLAHFLEGERAAEVVALDLFAADGFQEFVLFLCLHAFSEGADADILRHLHRGLDDVLGPLGEVGEEGHVDFEFVEVVILQRIERGVAAAEVVHPHLVSGGAEAVEDDADFSGVLHKHALCDFYAQERAGDAVFVSDAFDFFIDVAGEEVHAGQVEGNRDGGEAIVQALTLSLANEL